MRLLALALSLVVGCTPLSAVAKPPAKLPGPRAAPRIVLGVVTDAEVFGVLVQLKAAYAGGDRNLLLVIDCPGGSVFAGLHFMSEINAFKQEKRVTLTCLVENLAASMAAVILQGACDVRLMKKSAVLLFHGASVAQVSGNETELANVLEFVKALNYAMATIVADRLGMTVEDYLAKTYRDWVMTSTGALIYHAVDGVLDN